MRLRGDLVAVVLAVALPGAVAAAGVAEVAIAYGMTLTGALAELLPTVGFAVGGLAWLVAAAAGILIAAAMPRQGRVNGRVRLIQAMMLASGISACVAFYAWLCITNALYEPGRTVRTALRGRVPS